MSAAYFLWEREYEEGYCVLGALEKVQKGFQIMRGISRLQGFPEDAYFAMQPDFPKDIQVPDNVYGAVHVVISKKARAVLEPLTTNRVEFLPVKIKDHKGRTASAEHFVLNPLDICDCIDLNASQVDWNDINPDQIGFCQGLYFKPDSIPKDYTLFRLRHWEENIVVRDDVIGALKGAGLTGLFFVDPLTVR